MVKILINISVVLFVLFSVVKSQNANGVPLAPMPAASSQGTPLAAMPEINSSLSSPPTPLAPVPNQSQQLTPLAPLPQGILPADLPNQRMLETPLAPMPGIANNSTGTFVNGTYLPNLFPTGQLLPTLLPYQREEGVCSSINVLHNVSDFLQLQNCRTIEGYLHIVHIYANETQFANLTFPKLTEITDYLAVVNVNGLKSLGKLFPSLTVIRGNNQLLKGYSMIIVENPDLEEIGLISLQHIGRGAVRINSNPKLCYEWTVDWSLIAPHSSHAFHYIDGNGKTCQLCAPQLVNGQMCMPAAASEYSFYKDSRRLCWNATTCQHVCPRACSRAGCNERGECCDKTCLGGCTETNSPQKCKSCVAYKYNGVCVDSCPSGTIIHNNRRCITKEDCYASLRPLNVFNTNLTYSLNPYFEFDGKCVLDCPLNYAKISLYNTFSCYGDKDAKHKTCSGVVVNTSSDLKSLKGCTHINGSISLLYDVFIASKTLDTYLGEIEEIDGYLAVIGFKSKNLYTLRSLKVIRGKELYNNKYALFLMYNENLEAIMASSKIPEIRTGALFFAMNPSLCDSKIREFQQLTTVKSGSCCDAVVIGNDEHC